MPDEAPVIRALPRGGLSREKAAENRERIVETASRLFREHGFEGVGVDAIMSAAGLTHGGSVAISDRRAISPPRR
jgi:hypothetical protein